MPQHGGPRNTAYALSRRFRLAPNPEPGDPANGGRPEIAWDGHRVLASRVDHDVRMWSADFREWTKNFSTLVFALSKLPAKEIVLDGFVCALDERGRPSFELLRAHVEKPGATRVAFVAWDLLFVDGEELAAQPLHVRTARLAKLFQGARDPLVLSQALEGTPALLLESLVTMGMRGLVLRDPDDVYPPKKKWIVLPTDDSAPVVWERTLSAPPTITNRDKVLYPRDGITKADIAAYYDDVAPLMMPLLADRPIVCQRWPDGIDDFTWYQHRMPPRAPDYLRAVWIEGGDGKTGGRKMNRRIIIESREGLAWMVNQAALTFHGWSSRAETLSSPDWVILDLDPGEATRWDQVIDIALAIRRLLEMLELPSVVKTSGQKGLHILVPIGPGHTALQAHELAFGMSKLVGRLFPNDICLEATTETRRGRLYLDHLQNYMGKSLVLPYSLRAVDRAPASTPIGWDEVTPKLDPRSFNLRTLRARLDQKGDLISELVKGKARLGPALAKLKQ